MINDEMVTYVLPKRQIWEKKYGNFLLLFLTTGCFLNLAKSQLFIKYHIFFSNFTEAWDVAKIKGTSINKLCI